MKGYIHKFIRDQTGTATGIIPTLCRCGLAAIVLYGAYCIFH